MSFVYVYTVELR